MTSNPKVERKFWFARNKLYVSITAVIFLLAVACYAVWYSVSHPPRPWLIRSRVHSYLKKQSGHNDFTTSFPLPSKDEMSQTTSAPLAPADASGKGKRTGKDFNTLTKEYSALMTESLQLQQRLSGSESNQAAQAELKQKQQAIAPILEDMREIQKGWASSGRKTQNGTPNRLAQAQEDFSEEMQQKLQQASSYSEMYRLIGQELWVAGQLLSSRNPNHRRFGVAIAMDTAFDAQEIAQQGWLACRICDGYVLPNLDVADPERRSPNSLENLVADCADIFGQNGDRMAVVRMYELMIAKAVNVQAADNARSQLARAYERAGDFKQAIQTWREIKSTNDYRWDINRIPMLEKRLKGN